MTKFIKKSRAEGTISAPTSKSIAHRLLISAAMCDGQTSVIDGITPCEDVLATIDCLRALGVKIDYADSKATVVGTNLKAAKPSDILNCRESGSTLRFLIPICLLSGEDITLSGSEKLISRPQGVYEDIAKNKGFIFNKRIDRITLSGKLKAGEYSVRGDVSSQFITGLLFALSSLDGESRINITTAIESKSYIDLTIAALGEFGTKVIWENDSTLLIYGNQEYRAKNLTVEGDWSGAAFLEAFNHIGGAVNVQGMNSHSIQGDRVCCSLFDKLDGGFCEIDIEDCPDLGPILFTLAAIKEGALFAGTRRLKIKESDRAEAMKSELAKFGAELVVEENQVTVKKSPLHSPTEKLFGHNDHRIVMSLAVICSLFGGEIEGCEAVNKSYPTFFEDIQNLGILTYETD